MNEALSTKLNNLPGQAGVYQFLNDKGTVIYVGKAKNLKNRVRSYFHSSITSPKTVALVTKISDFELIVTASEVEALILENNLIKKFKPRYNVNLKDDKTYPFIKVTNEPFPRIFPTRQIIRDGSKYFGPYTDVRNMKVSLRAINQIFRIRSCKYAITKDAVEKKKFKICLDYHIKKCDGPCEGFISQSAYNEMVAEVIKMLKGKTGALLKEQREKMEQFVKELFFEKAAEVRDKIRQLESLADKQKVVSDDVLDRDVIAIAYEGKEAASSILNIREGKITGKKEFRLSVERETDSAEIYSALIKQYYANEFVDIPNEIVLETEPDDLESITEWLSTKIEHKLKITIPQRESKLKSILKMSSENALLQLKEWQLQKMKKEGNVPYTLSALQRDLHLKHLPKKIVCFDNSNLQGSDAVASMVTFENGKSKKSEYKKFIIKTVVGPDDFASMREVITRHFSKLIEAAQPLPDLIMVDGGKGQLSSAVDALNELGITSYQIIGLAKRLEEVFLPNESEAIAIPKTSSSLKLLQQLRDEAHRFAITFHRLRRNKRTITTELLEIKGIGKSLADKLLLSFGSVSIIKKVPLEELEKVIGKKKADLVFAYFSSTKGKSN
ncbi:MAG: excinuclease ABC subunit C [Ignavibacteria bacterium CG_4_10_14_3_um_filter_37_18]|nr:MAG: excinuclease ABC subunit C [Ignavibacteria bacterium CG_4_10_14_3_um_filter_37_18]